MAGVIRVIVVIAVLWDPGVLGRNSVYGNSHNEEHRHLSQEEFDFLQQTLQSNDTESKELAMSILRQQGVGESYANIHTKTSHSSVQNDKEFDDNANKNGMDYASKEGELQNKHTQTKGKNERDKSNEENKEHAMFVKNRIPEHKQDQIKTFKKDSIKDRKEEDSVDTKKETLDSQSTLDKKEELSKVPEPLDKNIKSSSSEFFSKEPKNQIKSEKSNAKVNAKVGEHLTRKISVNKTGNKDTFKDDTADSGRRTQDHHDNPLHDGRSVDMESHGRVDHRQKEQLHIEALNKIKNLNKSNDVKHNISGNDQLDKKQANNKGRSSSSSVTMTRKARTTRTVPTFSSTSLELNNNNGVTGKPTSGVFRNKSRLSDILTKPQIRRKLQTTVSQRTISQSAATDTRDSTTVRTVTHSQVQVVSTVVSLTPFTETTTKVTAEDDASKFQTKRVTTISTNFNTKQSRRSSTTIFNGIRLNSRTPLAFNKKHSNNGPLNASDTDLPRNTSSSINRAKSSQTITKITTDLDSARSNRSTITDITTSSKASNAMSDAAKTRQTNTSLKTISTSVYHVTASSDASFMNNGDVIRTADNDRDVQLKEDKPPEHVTIPCSLAQHGRYYDSSSLVAAAVGGAFVGAVLVLAMFYCKQRFNRYIRGDYRRVPLEYDFELNPRLKTT